MMKKRPPLPARWQTTSLLLVLLVVLLAPLTAVAAETSNADAAAGVAAGDAAPEPRYKILALLPLGGTSHTFDLVAVASRLALKHTVAVAAPALDRAHTAAAARRLGGAGGGGPVEIVDVDDFLAMDEFRQLVDKDALATGGLFAILTTFQKLPRVMADKCARLAANTTLMEDWRRYDAILTFTFPPPGKDTCACLIAELLGIPLLHVRDMVLSDLPPDVPQMGSGLTRSQVRNTWRGRAKNLGFWLFHRLLHARLGAVEHGAFTPLRARLDLPRRRGACVPWVEVVSGSWLLEEPHAIAPPLVMTGPISPRPAGRIGDPKIAAFVGGAEEHGLVLASFGSSSAFFGQMIGLDEYREIAAGFAELAPMRVLWQLADGALPDNATAADLGLGANTLVAAWAPINDVLGHAATRVFVSHCGQKSTLESMFHGVPIAGAPFMVEQFGNCARASARGFAVTSPESVAMRARKGDASTGFTRAGIVQVVRAAITKGPAARRAGAAMRLMYQHRKPVDRAVDEIEAALLHGGYDPERAALTAAAHDRTLHGGAGGNGGGNGRVAADGLEAAAERRDEL